MKVAIIGGGPAGIVALKECLSAGFKAKLFEQSTALGGQWGRGKLTAFSSPNGSALSREISNVYDNLTTNTSSLTTGFSDFPMPDDFACIKERRPHMTAEEFREYIVRYVTAFRLESHVSLNTKVEAVVKRGNVWHVTSNCGEKNSREETFDAVTICTGNYYYPKPYRLGAFSFSTEDLFERESAAAKAFEEQTGAKIVHAANYRSPNDYLGKNVLVVGFGNSGIDIAADILSVAEAKAKQETKSASSLTNVYLSASDRPLVALKVLPGGGTADWHVLNFVKRVIPNFVMQTLSTLKLRETMKEFPEKFRENIRERLQQKATRKVLGPEILPSLLREKKLHFVDRIVETAGWKKFKTADGTVLNDIDALLLTTGYQRRYPFYKGGEADTPPLRLEDNSVTCVYRHVFHVDDPTLSFVGLNQNVVPLALCELQARWIAAVLSKKVSLPSREEQKKATEAELKALLDAGGRISQFHTVDQLFYSLSITDALGVPARPSWHLPVWVSLHLLSGVAFPCVWRLGDEAKRIAEKRSRDDASLRGFEPIAELQRSCRLQQEIIQVERQRAAASKK